MARAVPHTPPGQRQRRYSGRSRGWVPGTCGFVQSWPGCPNLLCVRTEPQALARLQVQAWLHVNARTAYHPDSNRRSDFMFVFNGSELL